MHVASRCHLLHNTFLYTRPLTILCMQMFDYLELVSDHSKECLEVGGKAGDCCCSCFESLVQVIIDCDGENVKFLI